MHNKCVNLMHFRYAQMRNLHERAGSRVAVVLYGEVRVFYRPHPSPNTDKGAIASIRKWLELYEVTP